MLVARQASRRSAKAAAISAASIKNQYPNPMPNLRYCQVERYIATSSETLGGRENPASATRHFAPGAKPPPESAASARPKT
jgi:hypothetical protein